MFAIDAVPLGSQLLLVLVTEAFHALQFRTNCFEIHGITEKRTDAEVLR